MSFSLIIIALLFINNVVMNYGLLLSTLNCIMQIIHVSLHNCYYFGYLFIYHYVTNFSVELFTIHQFLF